MYLAFGIACALVERHTSGKGQVIDGAIIDGVSHLMGGIHGQLAGGTWKEHRGEHILGGAAPWNTTYLTRDNQYITVCSIEARFYALLLNKLGLDPQTLPDRMDRQHWPALRERFAHLFKQRTRDEWCALLEGTDVCFAPVLSVREMPQHPHVRAREMLATSSGFSQPVPAPRLDRTPGAIQGPTVSKPGEHSDAVLGAWGFSADEIQALKAAGVVA
jgi:alpha-methylacyl-CoA racemase